MSEETGAWYDRQASISKTLTYAAILVFLAGAGWGGYEGYLKNGTLAMAFAIGGTAMAALLMAYSAIIDLLIVHAEALRSGRSR